MADGLGLEASSSAPQPPIVRLLDQAAASTTSKCTEKSPDQTGII